ncbi:SAM-dependent methyltransferase [Luedemannella flava]
MSSSRRSSGVRLDGGAVVALDALVVAPRFVARSAVLAGLGLEPEELVVDGRVVGSRIPSGMGGATAVPGVWVAGNITDLMGTVISSAAAGTLAGAAINGDLVAEETDVAVFEYRHRIHTMFEQEGWEERYRAKPTIWSGNPNPQLVAEVADLAPGRALDVGCGEGADAAWLAARGWRVTGVDISTVALDRARAHVDSAGLADRIELVHADLRVTPPEPGAYDLVSAQFMHLPPGPRRELYAQLASAVAPGGTLLIVGHDPTDLHTSVHRAHFPDMMFTVDEVASALDRSDWDVTVAESRPARQRTPRAATSPSTTRSWWRDAGRRSLAVAARRL